MAKMALNGYEIGIQRKIKPADHIQSMADKIQDTVVTKHPLNTDTSAPGDGSNENTLKRPLNKSFDKSFKLLENNVHSSPSGHVYNLAHHTNVHSNNTNAPVPPPLPTTPVPTFQSYNLPITNILNNIATKNTDSSLKDNDINIHDMPITNKENCQNGGYSSSDDSNKDKYEKSCNSNSFKNKLPSKDTFTSDAKSEINYSNTLTKKKLFERPDASNESILTDTIYKVSDKNYNSNSNKDYLNKNHTNNDVINDNLKNTTNQDEVVKKLSNNLHDNTLYTYKSVKSNGTNFINDNNINNKTGNLNEKVETCNTTEDVEGKDDSEEVVVRRREKKNIRNDDGRRDSHIIARPLSTMTSVDVAEGQYPICHICDKAITRGPFITALGRIWCPEHFVCVNATCRRQLQDIGFVEENGQLYCEYCFEQYIAPACDKCHAKIKGDCLNAIGKHFHPECFSCVYCGKLFGNNPFFLEDGLPYCEADWNELFTTKCFACGFPVEAGDRWVEALNNNYHSQCFNCTVCKKNLEGQSFFAKGGRPFCKMHAR
ncbi:unnamed protein product [Euphydryas editha]|uniref:LIM zinc-binding domain-containing protein n=1 Tax=Euphydryas editha TaxID=104508 RepID=A0AAU9V9S1_EUPED|nr:unnamed protein product [Euphydryas editha]